MRFLNTKGLGMFVAYNEEGTLGTITADVETINTLVELRNLFKNVPLDTLQKQVKTDAGMLAKAVLANENANPLRELVDELLETWNAGDKSKFVPRTSLLLELEDVLRAKTITPYRRSRINKALKRECIRCYGGGKVPRTVNVDDGIPGFGPRKQRHEIDSRSPDCPTCKGTGIKPPKDEVIELTSCDIYNDETSKVLKAAQGLIAKLPSEFTIIDEVEPIKEFNPTDSIPTPSTQQEIDDNY